MKFTEQEYERCRQANRIHELEQQIAEATADVERLTRELEGVNNEFGSQTADWPGARERVAELKQYGSEQWRRADNYRAALELITAVRHITGSAQGAFRSNLAIADAAINGADLRNIETIEAVVKGTWSHSMKERR
jgi:uncharacterized coiled-coil protein SlyX